MFPIPIIGIFDKKSKARNTSIVLGDYFDNFINEQIASGKYSSVSEVVRTALRRFEEEESKTKSLINELKIGEKSGKVKDFHTRQCNQHISIFHLANR
ncbi:type II toxin-antitoxin system ParD family antitoxin [Flavobacterium sp. TP390]|uniref:Type II toxin-antitoxin system ParD family antitoxin n=1 Tax=Flavobacterium profundi TaxID=1774945 RepID=A0A6I4ISN9_9FLAO|nr:type II toxin-antitoxin system ParD family antitoxin [Flavobacterium profundi]MVO09407.1 type II toxin-antitoxin system ParD family antitoxin [Flavobacterium profundi]